MQNRCNTKANKGNIHTAISEFHIKQGFFNLLNTKSIRAQIISEKLAGATVVEEKDGNNVQCVE